MTNTNWREEFDEKLSGLHCFSWDDTDDSEYVKSFIQQTLDSALKDQKAELLEAVEKIKTIKHFENNPDVYLMGKSDGFNHCLEIIRGLIEKK